MARYAKKGKVDEKGVLSTPRQCVTQSPNKMCISKGCYSLENESTTPTPQGAIISAEREHHHLENNKDVS